MLVALASVATACSQSARSSVDLAAEEEAIRAVNARWLSAFQAHDAAGEAAVFASDGVEYRAGLERIIGPAAIESYDRKFFAENPTLAVSWSTDAIHIADSGDLAIQTGEFQASGVGPSGDQEDWGRILTVWKKEDGQWKVAHAMVSSTKPQISAE
ncbi:MAG TPA: SgcJ/EcaC family oxidoreductase [Longimicrobiales bacterium]|nr:SgcJ/EcaC family oxidoreductase [Longimicrobiales bacterium]